MGSLTNVTDAVKAVLVAGEEEARSLGHGFVSTEHLVIALLDATESAGVDEARRQGASAPAAQSFVEAAFASASDSIGYVSDEQSLRCRRRP